MKNLPPPSTLTILERVDAASDRFEREWQCGDSPRIEDYLAAAAAEDQDALLRALLGVELELRGRGAAPLQVDEFLGRFPQQPQIVAEVLALAGQPDSGQPTAPRSATGNTISISSPAADTSNPASASPAPQRRLEKLGRFDLLEVLGEGAFGTVYRAHDPELDRLVAIKVPREGVLRTADDHQRFRREARAAARLNHPNICQVHEVGEFGGQDYIVMAYVEGKPLSKIIKTGKVQTRQAAAAVRKLAMALAEAHRQGIVHRDLKPANIMVNPRGEPVVMDFGLARLCQPGDAQITRSGAIMGSPAYMSPEQARGDTSNIGPASDIYSLGVILYELLTGRRPFEGTVTEVLGKILHVEPEPPSRHRANIDPRLEAICLKAMAKAPAARHASMEELAQDLGDYVKSRAPTASDAGNPPVAVEPTDAGSTQYVANMFANVSAGLQKQTEEIGQRHRKLVQLVAGGVVLTVVAVFAGILFFARTLDCSGSGVSDAAGVHLAEFKDLRTLGLMNTKVTSAILPHLAAQKQLHELNLVGTTISDTELEHLKGLRQLSNLDMARTQISDAGLKKLHSLTGLRRLRIHDTKVTDAGVAALKAALPECRIEK